jgi:hypothetical protein
MLQVCVCVEAGGAAGASRGLHGRALRRQRRRGRAPRVTRLQVAILYRNPFYVSLVLLLISYLYLPQFPHYKSIYH